MKATPLGFGMCMMHMDKDSNAGYAEGSASPHINTYRVADGNHECVDCRTLLFQAAAQLLGRWAQVNLVLQSHQTSLSDDEEPSVCNRKDKR